MINVALRIKDATHYGEAKLHRTPRSHWNKIKVVVVFKSGDDDEIYAVGFRPVQYLTRVLVCEAKSHFLTCQDFDFFPMALGTR